MNTPNSRFANGDSQSYWAAARAGRLEFQQCQACGNVQFPPRVQCAKCWSDTLQSVEASCEGVIEAITIVRRAPLKQFREQVPYAIVSVITAEGPRMITNLVGEGAESAQIGDAVMVCFEPNPEGEVLPQFQLAESA